MDQSADDHDRRGTEYVQGNTSNVLSQPRSEATPQKGGGFSIACSYSDRLLCQRAQAKNEERKKARLVAARRATLGLQSDETPAEEGRQMVDNSANGHAHAHGRNSRSTLVV